MDRNNGGDPKVPPRPPKSIVRVHRPRAPDPQIMTDNLPPQLSPKPSHLRGININNNNNNNNITTTTTRTSNSNRLSENSPRIGRTSFSPIVNVNSSSNTINNNNNNNLSSSRSPRPLSVSPTLSTTFTRRRSPNPLPPTPIQTVSQSVQNSEIQLSTGATPVVTLAQPRPENERLTNEYVDTPFSNNLQVHSSAIPRGGIGGASIIQSSTHLTTTPINGVNQTNRILGSNNNNNNINVSERNLRPLPKQQTGTHNNSKISSIESSNVNVNVISPHSTPEISSVNFSSNVIIKQPVSSFTKGETCNNTLSEASSLHHQSHDTTGNSIICPKCDKCRCEECQRPRQLPSKWICGNTCLCSSETLIDYTSCLCCVKALYYHCSKDHEMESENETIVCADNPCSCAPYNLFTRWACLGILTFPLPCLLCYWPMRGCVNLCAKCYAKYSRHGCQCSANTHKNVRSLKGLRQEKELLDSSSDY